MIEILEITESPIDIAAVTACVADELRCQCFVPGDYPSVDGFTQRDSEAESVSDRLIETSHLIYEAYQEMALAKLRELVTEAGRRWPIHKVTIIHRIGRVDP